MMRYGLVPGNWGPADDRHRRTPVSLGVPVERLEEYFDRLAIFGLACVVAAVAGKLVMGTWAKS